MTWQHRYVLLAAVMSWELVKSVALYILQLLFITLHIYSTIIHHLTLYFNYLFITLLLPCVQVNLKGKYTSLEETMKQVDSVTKDDIVKVTKLQGLMSMPYVVVRSWAWGIYVL